MFQEKREIEREIQREIQRKKGRGERKGEIYLGFKQNKASFPTLLKSKINVC